MPSGENRFAGLSSALILDAVLASTDDAPMPTMRRGYYETIFGDIGKLPGSDKGPRGLVTMLIKSGANIPRMYLCCGTEDFLVQQNRGCHRFLLENCVAHTYVEGHGAHDWEFWDTYIRKVLDWLPLNEPAQGNGSGNV